MEFAMLELEKIAPSKDDCNIAMLAHLLGIFTGFIGSLVIWLLLKDRSAYVGQESKEALNFQITVAIAFFAAWLMTFILIGFLLVPLLWVANMVFCILGAIAASKGEGYRYPAAIRLLQ
jgi:uncharacterized Tic20 family protein